MKATLRWSRWGFISFQPLLPHFSHPSSPSSHYASLPHITQALELWFQNASSPSLTVTLNQLCRQHTQTCYPKARASSIMAGASMTQSRLRKLSDLSMWGIAAYHWQACVIGSFLLRNPQLILIGSEQNKVRSRKGEVKPFNYSKLE